LFDMNNVPGAVRAIGLGKNGGPVTDAIAVYNNSAYTGFSSSTSPFIIVDISDSPTNVVIRNNLGYAPNNTASNTAPVRDLSGGGFTASNNSTTAQIQGVSPNFVATPPTQPSHWRPQAGSYAINGGYVGPPPAPVFSDFFAAPRTGNHLGAVNP
jgi:hypothetical protein